MAPHVVIVAGAFPPRSGGGVLRMTKLVKYLPALGWRVTVVTSGHGYGDDPALLDEIPDGVDVVRVATQAASAETRLRLLRQRVETSDLVHPFVAAARAILWSFTVPDRAVGWARRVARDVTLDPADVVVSSGPPHSGHLAAIGLADRLGAPHVVDLRDRWVGNPQHASPFPWRWWIERRQERRVFEHAARIVVVSPPEVAAVEAAPGGAGKGAWIPNGFDAQDLVALPPRELPAGRPVRLLYAGSLMHANRVGRLFEAIGSLADDEASLTFVGLLDPVHRRALERAVPAHRLDVRPHGSHRDALRWMAWADVLLVVTSGGGVGESTITGKLYEYLAVGRPVLHVGPPGPAADLVRASRAGVTVDPEDGSSVERALRQVLAMARDPGFTPAPRELLAPFDRRHLAERWAALLEEVVGESMAGRPAASP